VVLPESDARLTDIERSAVAAAIGFSETVFVQRISKDDGGVLEIALRYITPEEEVDLCGHATVACLGLLHEKGLLLDTCRGRLLTRAGPVSFLVEPSDPPEAHMSQLPVTVDPPLEADVAARLAGALNAELDLTWAPRVASTGLRDILVAVKDDEELAAMAPDMEAVTLLSRELKVVGVHAFVMPPAAGAEGGLGGSPGSRARAGCIRVRNFAPLYGIDEESATGTSNCALACALLQSAQSGEAEGVVDLAYPGAIMLFSQGDGMAEPSRIAVRLPGEEGGEPWVGGCFKVVETKTVQLSNKGANKAALL